MLIEPVLLQNGFSSVYILYSPSADKYYVGQTSDLELRLQYHNELNPNSYTSKHRPWELRRAIAVADQSPQSVIRQ